MDAFGNVITMLGSSIGLSDPFSDTTPSAVERSPSCAS